MNKKIKIYMIVIAFLTGFFLYALFIMKDDYKVEEKDKLPPTVHIKKLQSGILIFMNIFLNTCQNRFRKMF